MNFDILKNISDAFYIDFKDIISGIKDQSENIYSRFRMAYEELLKQINYHRQYVSDKEGFYNRIVNNENFLHDMIYIYKCDPKTMRCIVKVQEKGNYVTHNALKVFDEKDVRDIFYHMLLLARKILYYEKDINDFQFSIDLVNEEFDKLLNNSHHNYSKDNFQKEVMLLNDKVISLFKDFNESGDNKDLLLETFKNLISIILNYIISFDTNYHSLEDLKIGKYSNLYKAYCSFDNISNYDNNSDIASSLINEAFIIKNDMLNLFNLHLLENLLPLIKKDKENDDQTDVSIINAVEEVTSKSEENDINGVVYYVETQAPIIAGNKMCYAVSLRKAINDNNRGNTVYSAIKLPNNYALEISLKSTNIELSIGNNIPIFIITGYRVAIRPCEIKNLVFAINGVKINNPSKKSNFYQTLMNYLQNNQCTLLDILSSSEKMYHEFINSFKNISAQDCLEFISAMDKAREIINANEYESGANLLRYFTSKLNNYVLKDQLLTNNDQERWLKDLYFNNKSLRFDRNPYSFDLHHHRTDLNDLYTIFPKNDYVDDIVARKLKDTMIKEDTLFIDLDKYDKDTKNKIINYNNSLTYDDAGKLAFLDNYVYSIDDYLKVKHIYQELKNKCNGDNYDDYQERLASFKQNNQIDSNNKMMILDNAFHNAKLCMILGEAGSGKTELLCHYFTKIFQDLNILFISNTHSCLSNMRQRVKEKCGLKDNYHFKTAKTISESRSNYTYDVIIIDECKIISNRHMEKIFQKVNSNYLIMAGDINQIDAIELGNWFDITSQRLKAVNGNLVFNLNENHRTNHESLLTIWQKVKNHDQDTLDYLIDNNYVETISEDIYQPKDESEIILCLNYRGLYGITSLNSHFQNQNPNPAFKNNLDVYKVGNPIVFNENANDLYGEYIYNNLKGEIRDIKQDGEFLYFVLWVETYIPQSENYVITSNQKDNWSLINIKFRKYTDVPDEEKEKEYLCPFNVTYALSIHKAQGLEYNSVKIIITPESEEIIDNRIFYTAITRAKKDLKIYITKNGQMQLLNLLSKKDERKDVELLNKLFDED